MLITPKLGHRSIVNTALFHPHFLHVVTAGVEKNIVLHSPTPSSPCTQNLQRSPARVRELKDEDLEQDRQNYYSALCGSYPMNSERPDDREERQTLSLFDQLSPYFHFVGLCGHVTMVITIKRVIFSLMPWGYFLPSFLFTVFFEKKEIAMFLRLDRGHLKVKTHRMRTTTKKEKKKKTARKHQTSSDKKLSLEDCF